MQPGSYIAAGEWCSMNNKDSQSPLVSVIIVTWNGKHLLSECLGSLAAQSFRDFEIIVVDNGSVDGSAEYVRSTHPTVKVIDLKKNHGYAGGNNVGIRASAGKYIALLNNDTKADTSWLQNLIAAAEKSPGTGMWASKILSYYNPEMIDNTGLLIYRDGIARGRGRLEQDKGQYDAEGEALFPSGCAGLYLKKMINEIGTFDEDFFAYADDVDLGLRARIAGWNCRYVPTARVYHKYSSSSSAYSPMKAFLAERNRIWVLLKYYPPELILASPFYSLKRFLIHYYGVLTGRGASGRFSKENSLLKLVIVLCKAWCSAVIALPRVLRQRRDLARIKRIRRPQLYRLFREFGISATELALKE